MMMMMMMRMSPRNHPQPANHRSPRTVVADKAARARRGRGHPGRPADATPSGIRPRPRRRTCTSLGVVPTTMRAALAKPPRARRGRTVWKGVQTRALARARDASAPDTPSAMPVDAEGRRATVCGAGLRNRVAAKLILFESSCFLGSDETSSQSEKRHVALATAPSALEVYRTPRGLPETHASAERVFSTPRERFVARARLVRSWRETHFRTFLSSRPTAKPS